MTIVKKAPKPTKNDQVGLNTQPNLAIPNLCEPNLFYLLAHPGNQVAAKRSFELPINLVY